jgi:excisionase family DNA binding protein
MGVSRSRVYELMNSGEIPSRKDGRRRLIHRDDLEKWFSLLPPTPTRAPSEPPTGPLLPREQQETAIERAIEPEPDWAAIYRERFRALKGLGPEEAHFRALDHAVNLCRHHFGCDLE